MITEDFQLKGMVKNPKLAQGINDAAWGQFSTMLEYKGRFYGYEIRKLDRFSLVPSVARSMDTSTKI